MADTTEILLTNLLSRLEKLSSEVLDKSEFEKFQIRLDHKFESVDKQLEKSTADINEVQKSITKHEAKLAQNTNFITNVSSGGKWLIRVVFLAMLGAASSILPPMIVNLAKPSPPIPLTVTSPYPIAQPQKP